MFKLFVILSDPTIRVNRHQQEKHCKPKAIFEIVQANNGYLHKVDTVSIHLIMLDPKHILNWKYVFIRGSDSNDYIQQLGFIPIKKDKWKDY